MSSKIAVIAILGLVTSAACIGAAAAIGGKDFGNGMDFSMFDGRPACETAPGATATSRDLAWDGSDHAGLAIPATANYTPGTDDMVHAIGDAQVLAHLRIRDGIVEMDCHSWRGRAEGVTITLPGRVFRKFTLAGTGKMNLNQLNQPSLRIEVAGAAAIKANGKVDDLKIEMAGVSRGDFSQVTGKRADIEMAGVSNADIAPSDAAKIQIAGPSEVNLHSNPKDLDTQIAGPGHLHKLAGG